MTDDTPTIKQPKADETPPRRLSRSADDRVLAGVAGGLGNYFRIDPVIFRIGFGISLLFGGIGGLAYLLLALLVPTEGEPDLAQRLGRRLQSRGIWRGLAAVVIGLLAIAGLIALTGASAAVVALGQGVSVGIAVIVIGALLVVAAARRGGARWLILPAVAIAIGAGVASAADLNFRGGVGDREYQPLSAAEIPADGYELGVGRLVVDLRRLDWQKEGTVHLKLRLGAGQANVFVPDDVCVASTTHVGAGESEVVGERNSGLGVDHQISSASATVPRLQLDAEVELGQLRVINSDTADIDDPSYESGSSDQELTALRVAEVRACAAP